MKPTLSFRPTIEQRLQATHRPENRSPVMYQRWAHLLFLHWSMDPQLIQATLPPGLHADTFEGRAFLGVVPFFMKGVRPRFCPPFPGLSHFLELNLRTYVHDEQGNPGVWFYSLDANQWMAVKIAQTVFSLPYVYARMSGSVGSDQSVTLESTRKGGSAQRFTYKPSAPLPASEPGSLQFFLAERYLLFAYRKRSRALLLGRVHHRPYSLYHADVEDFSTALFSLNGFEEPARIADHVMLSPGVDVGIYRLGSAL